MNEYEKQANDFCKKYGVEVKAEFDHYGYHFDDDKENRDIYHITITRKDKKPMLFKFGQSLNKSNLKAKQEELKKYALTNDVGNGFCIVLKHIVNNSLCNKFTQKRWNCSVTDLLKEPVPSSYDILACLTKCDPNTFESFCSDYGYDIDSIKANKLFLAVDKEWHEVNRLFGDCLDELNDIA